MLASLVSEVLRGMGREPEYRFLPFSDALDKAGEGRVLGTFPWFRNTDREQRFIYSAPISRRRICDLLRSRGEIGGPHRRASMGSRASRPCGWRAMLTASSMLIGSGTRIARGCGRGECRDSNCWSRRNTRLREARGRSRWTMSRRAARSARADPPRLSARDRAVSRCSSARSCDGRCRAFPVLENRSNAVDSSAISTRPSEEVASGRARRTASEDRLGDGGRGNLGRNRRSAGWRADPRAGRPPMPRRPSCCRAGPGRRGAMEPTFSRRAACLRGCQR